MRSLVEPFWRQEFGRGAGRPALAHNLDLDADKGLRRRIDHDGAEAERPGKGDGPFEQGDVAHDETEGHGQSSALWVMKCARIRCTSAVKTGSAIASSARGRGKGT